MRTHAAIGISLAMAAVACSAGSDDGLEASSESLKSKPPASPTTTFVVPANERARIACRAEANKHYCTRVEAASAIASCLKKLDGVACAHGGSDCIRMVSVDQECTTVAPIYPDAKACKAPVPGTCAFYSECLEAKDPCGANGYALGYGEKYCYRFANDTTELSERGREWRDSTMLCLQEHLVPLATSAAKTSCKQILDSAFGNHPGCYTQPAHSICFLPVDDSQAILNTIDTADVLSAASRKQMAAVIKICVGQLASHIAKEVGREVGRIFSDSEEAPTPDAEDLANSSPEAAEQYRFWRDMQSVYGAPEEQLAAPQP